MKKSFMKEWLKSGLKYWYEFVLTEIFIIGFVMSVYKGSELFICVFLGVISYIFNDIFINKVFEDMKGKGFFINEK